MKTIPQRIAYAANMVGSRSLSGWCERFVRQAFGFPARYSSATLAWRATRHRHSNINDAPAGVPIFWELHPANPNHGLGHVALSVGGGYCISTSVGPGKSIGKVRIADLTAAWGMRPRGWTEDYHGQRIYTPPAKPKPSGRHILPDGAVRARLRESGVDYPDDGLLSTWVRQWQERQLYAPGLIADAVWGPFSEAHYLWTKLLQRTMRPWRGERDTAIDGDYYTATDARVSEIQDRNLRTDAHPTGVYVGALDDIPGPVFCQMLGIDPHPGL